MSSHYLLIRGTDFFKNRRNWDGFKMSSSLVLRGWFLYAGYGQDELFLIIYCILRGWCSLIPRHRVIEIL